MTFLSYYDFTEQNREIVRAHTYILDFNHILFMLTSHINRYVTNKEEL